MKKEEEKNNDCSSRRKKLAGKIRLKEMKNKKTIKKKEERD